MGSQLRGLLGLGLRLLGLLICWGSYEGFDMVREWELGIFRDIWLICGSLFCIQMWKFLSSFHHLQLLCLFPKFLQYVCIILMIFQSIFNMLFQQSFLISERAFIPSFFWRIFFRPLINQYFPMYRIHIINIHPNK